MQTIKILSAGLVCAGMVVSFGTNAAISTSVKEVQIKGDVAAFSTKDTTCWVREPTFLGNGGVSPLSNLFAEAGLNIVSDKNAPCEINYRGYLTTAIIGNAEKIYAMPVDNVVKNPEVFGDAPPAITAEAGGADGVMNKMDGYGTPKWSGGESAGAVPGGYLNDMGKAVGGALAGRILDGLINKKPELTPGIGHIKADIVFKRDGKKFSAFIDVYSASNTTEHPVDLLRAVAVRIVEEIKLKNGEMKPPVAEVAPASENLSPALESSAGASSVAAVTPNTITDNK